ncbi:alpha-E domain-containing protein [Akkermansiaceae bacterium]|nr:alpha-E domain-containing protein [Akkermansiaceae bacterium]
MLCRVADSLFWMGRYIERAENTARLVDVTHLSLLETTDSSDDLSFRHWSPILESLGDTELFSSIYKKKNSFNATYFLTFCNENPSSVFSCITHARENARMIRDQISVEMWETINKLYLFLKNTDADAVCGELRFEFFTKIKEFTLLFQGIKEVTFSHTLGYDFLSCGYFLERADKTCRILDTKRYMSFQNEEDDLALDTAQWSAVLRASSGLDAFFREFVKPSDNSSVSKFLLLSRHFPRSVLFCINQLQESIHAISGCPLTHFSCEAERKVGLLISTLRYISIERMSEEEITELIESIEDQLADIAVDLCNQYMFNEIEDPSADLTEE